MIADRDQRAGWVSEIFLFSFFGRSRLALLYVIVESVFCPGFIVRWVSL